MSAPCQSTIVRESVLRDEPTRTVSCEREGGHRGLHRGGGISTGAFWWEGSGEEATATAMTRGELVAELNTILAIRSAKLLWTEAMNEAAGERAERIVDALYGRDRVTTPVAAPAAAPETQPCFDNADAPQAWLDAKWRVALRALHDDGDATRSWCFVSPDPLALRGLRVSVITNSSLSGQRSVTLELPASAPEVTAETMLALGVLWLARNRLMQRDQLVVVSEETGRNGEVLVGRYGALSRDLASSAAVAVYDRYQFVLRSEASR